MLLPLLIVFARLISTSRGSDVVLGILGKTAFIECQLPISNTLVWQTQDGNVIAVNGKVTNENSTKYMIETQNGFRESLVIHDLTLADDKAFRCFDLKNSTYVDTTKLNVLARPIVMNVTSMPTQPLLEGTEVTFTCEADGGKPLPDIRWYIKFANGSVTQVSGNITDIKYDNGTGNRKNILTTSITRDLYQSTFICNMTASLFYQETLTLDTNVLLAPREPEITSANYNGSYDENSVVKLECMSEGSRPSLTIYWLLNGNRVGDVEVEVRPQNGTFAIQSNISKLLSRAYNGSVLTCAVTNKVLQDQGLPPRMINITLLASYKPNVSLEQNEYTTRLGDNVTLRCHIEANPLPTLDHLYWTHKGAMVDRKYYTLSNGSDIFSLTLQDVKIADAGNYSCHAINRLGTSASGQIQLTVFYAPVCEFESVQKFAVKRGETARLNCNMFASPNGVIFTWRYKQTDERITRIQATTDNQNNERVYNTLELTMGTQLRYEEIECYGSNARGISSRPCLYSVVTPGPAEPPSNCSTFVEDSQVKISCKAGFDGGSLQHFMLQKFDDFEFETLLTGDTPDFTFHTYENLTVRMCAFNDDFRSMLTCAESTSVSVNAAPPHSEPVKGKNSHEAAYIAGGVVASVGVIALAVIIVLLGFRRYNKKMSTRNKNDLESGSADQVTKSNKFDNWRKFLFIKRFTAPFRKSGKHQPATTDIRECEHVTDINDNDEIVTDLDDNTVLHHHTSRLASTPYYPLKAYRIDREENCIVINASDTQLSSKEQKAVPDVLNESTGFVLSPILARNFSDNSRYRADNPIECHSDVQYSQSFNKRYDEMTNIGLSNYYNTENMLDVLCKSDDKILSRIIDAETNENVCVKTLDKEYTDGDIADVLDSKENNDTVIDKTDAQDEIESDSNACEINSLASSNETNDFGDSVTVLKFMNVEFSDVPMENEKTSTLNNLHEQSLVDNSEQIFNGPVLRRSPKSKSLTGTDCNRDGRIARAFSLPYRLKKQQKSSLNKVKSLSAILKPETRCLQYAITHNSLSSYPVNVNAEATVAMDIEEIRDDRRSVSVSRINLPDAICDIDEFTLTINSDATIDYGSNGELGHSLETTLDTTGCSQIGDLAMMKSKSYDMPLDIDQFTLTISSKTDREGIAITEAIRNDDQLNTTELHTCDNDSIVDFTAEYKREEFSPRRDLLRRKSFIEAINNTEAYCSLIKSQDDKIGIKTDSKTQGAIDIKTDSKTQGAIDIKTDSETRRSYFNYGYEQDSDGRADYNIEGRDTHKKEERSDDNDSVNAVAFFKKIQC